MKLNSDIHTAASNDKSWSVEPEKCHPKLNYLDENKRLRFNWDAIHAAAKSHEPNWVEER